jgi:hypothetical protein
MFVIAARRYARRMPIVPIRIKPVSHAPATAPRVGGIKAPSRGPKAVPRTMTDALSSGSVMPMSAVGTSSTAKEHTNRTIVSTPSETDEARSAAA